MVKEIINFVFIYIMTFWIVIFCVLPFGIKTENNPQSGNDKGAPVKHNMRKKFLYTAIISLIIVGTYFILRKEGIIDLDKILEDNYVKN